MVVSGMYKKYSHIVISLLPAVVSGDFIAARCGFQRFTAVSQRSIAACSLSVLFAPPTLQRCVCP